MKENETTAVPPYYSQIEELKGYTHGERQIGKSTYPDDGIQLGHCHLLGTFNSLCNLLLVLRHKHTHGQKYLKNSTQRTSKHFHNACYIQRFLNAKKSGQGCLV